MFELHAVYSNEDSFIYITSFIQPFIEPFNTSWQGFIILANTNLYVKIRFSLKACQEEAAYRVALITKKLRLLSRSLNTAHII